MKIIRIIDDVLNRVTMYRQIVYGLSAILAIALIFSATGTLQVSTSGIFISIAISLSLCWLSELSLAKLFAAASNRESWLISGLIITCILPPATTVNRGLAIGVAAIVAMSSKYLLSWHQKHVFNPAAFGATIVGWVEIGYATWWVGNPTLAAAVAVIGLLVARKNRRLSLVGAFVVVSLLTTLLVSSLQGQAMSTAVASAITSGPLIFLAGFMLTEPATMPPRRYYQILFGVLVAVLFAAQIRLLTPTVALLIGNLFAWVVGSRQNLSMKLVKRQQLLGDMYEFIFEPNRPLAFQAGQYLQWTLPMKRADSRGNRRTFSIASAPSSKHIRIVMRIPDKASKFKQSLRELAIGDRVSAGQLGGDFCLPTDRQQPLVWIAGGVGITPFSSMAEELALRREKRQVVLIYISSSSEFIDEMLLNKAGIKVYRVASLEQAQLVLKDIVKQPNAYYISGPNRMVETYVNWLHKQGVSAGSIRRDFFSGY